MFHHQKCYISEVLYTCISIYLLRNKKKKKKTRYERKLVINIALVRAAEIKNEISVILKH